MTTASVLCIFVLVALANCLVLKIEPQQEECFWQETQENTPLTIQFQVTAGGLLDIDAHVYDLNGGILKSWSLATQGRHHWTPTESSKIKFCLSNHMARFTAKWVSFHIIQGHHTDAAKVEHLDPIEQEIQDLSEAVLELQEEQLFLRSVEHTHRDTVELTHSRIMLWSLFEAALLGVMGFIQVYHLKRFLEIRSPA